MTSGSNEDATGTLDEHVTEALAEEMDAERRRLESRVSDEDLVAYRHGGLSPEKAAEVRRLLVSDPEWARTFLEMDDLEALKADSGLAGGELGEHALDAAWDDFASRAQSGAEPSANGEPRMAREVPTPEHAEPASAGSRRVWLMAAIFLVGLLFGLWIDSKLGPFAEDVPQVRLVELEPIRPEAGPLLGDPLPFPDRSQADLLVIKLWPPTALELDGELPSSAPYRVLAGESRVVAAGRADVQEGAFILELPLEHMNLGDYSVELNLPEATLASGVVRYELRWRTSED